MMQQKLYTKQKYTNTHTEKSNHYDICNDFQNSIKNENLMIT